MNLAPDLTCPCSKLLNFSVFKGFLAYPVSLCEPAFHIFRHELPTNGKYIFSWREIAIKEFSIDEHPTIR